MIIKMVTKFKVCTPKPDTDLCMRVDLPPDKKIVENQDLATGPSWAVGRGPWAVGRGPPSRWAVAAADLLLAKSVLECCNFLSYRFPSPDGKVLGQMSRG